MNEIDSCQRLSSCSLFLIVTNDFRGSLISLHVQSFVMNEIKH